VARPAQQEAKGVIAEPARTRVEGRVTYREFKLEEGQTFALLHGGTVQFLGIEGDTLKFKRDSVMSLPSRLPVSCNLGNSEWMYINSIERAPARVHLTIESTKPGWFSFNF
jgi:hypothetical protein